MFRVVLATYTLMLSLMGPCPCCCSVARLAAAAMSTVGIENDGPTCCQPQCGNAEDNSDDHLIDSLRESQESGKQCQCVKSACEAVPPSLTKYTVDNSRSWFDSLVFAFFAPVPSDAEASSLVAACPSRMPRATLSGREIRVTLQSWLC